MDGGKMNQEKIGKFISELRKEKNLTQEKLAEKLGITKNAVSKWERGLSLMDISLLKPLSEILDVSITEILNGERMENISVSTKSEDVLIDYSSNEIKKIKKNKILVIFITFIITILGVILLDTFQAIIFKNSPFISWKENLADNDSWVDKGILIDTYYCTKEKDIINFSWHFKTSKFTCPIDNVDELNEAFGVSMVIKDGTLTRTGATIIITDISGKGNVYGSEYRIDKLENGEWKEAKIIFEGNYGWNLIGYLVDENNKLEMDVNWEMLYGKLEDGEYRIVKDTSMPLENERHYFSAEFKIN